MKLRLYSDLHHEFYTIHDRARMDKWIPELPDEDEQVFLFPGDICMIESPSTYVEFFGEMCERARAVMFVPGNHEFYRGSLLDAERKFFSEFSAPENFHWLAGGKTAEIDGVEFVGETLWTDFGKSVTDMMMTQMSLNDYRQIRTGDSDNLYKRTIRSEDILEQHHLALSRLEENLTDGCVVLSHHGPSYGSIADEYRNSNLNTAYCSELGYWLEDLGVTPALWVHGHTHTSFDYDWCGTRVVTNPRGYPKPGANRYYENSDYNETLILEI